MDALLFSTLDAAGQAERKEDFLTNAFRANPLHKDALPLISRAYDFSDAAHRDQVRKSGRIPYHSHAKGVALFLAPEFPSLYVAAGLLHDTVEDGMIYNPSTRKMEPVVLEHIAAYFAYDMHAGALCTLVELMTENPAELALRHEDRKIAHIRRMVTASRGIAIPIALADKLYNLRDPLTPEWLIKTSETVLEYLLFSAQGLQSPAGKPYREHLLYQALAREAESAFFSEVSPAPHAP
ncbi:MAG TPA: HD domain-containing protein [Candidatus Nanoarchaeia archaeon]|nr:HD domain-containing protein [Candidatus Nanoarchaeia archaeon]